MYTSATADLGILEGRLTAARAAALDELLAANIPTDLTGIIATQATLATAANLAIVAGYLDTEINEIINDIAIVQTDLTAILADVTGIAGQALKAYSEYEYEGDLGAAASYTPPARAKFAVFTSGDGSGAVNVEADIDVVGWFMQALENATPGDNWRGTFYQTVSQLLRIINDSGSGKKIMVLGELRGA